MVLNFRAENKLCIAFSYNSKLNLCHTVPFFVIIWGSVCIGIIGHVGDGGSDSAAGPDAMSWETKNRRTGRRG